MNDAELIELWLGNGLSENTRKAYCSWLRLWELYAQGGACGPWQQRTLAELQGFADWLAQRHYKGLPQACDCIRSLTNFAARIGYVKENPAAVWKVLAEKHKPLRTSYIADEQLAAMIEGEPQPHRRIFLLFLAATGARVSEAVNLSWENIETSDGGRSLVTILGKGNRWRTFALPPQWSMIFAALRSQDLARPFPWTRQWAWQLVQDAAKRAGLSLSPHQLRHAHITLRLKAGEDVAQIAATVGNSLQVILRYYEINPQENITDRLPAWASMPANTAVCGVDSATKPTARLELVSAVSTSETLLASTGEAVDAC